MEAKVITCAFCEGIGKDPFGVPSPLSTCQVCGGKGSVTIREPTEKCPHCQGTGVNTEINYLPCAQCGGKGVVTLKKQPV